MGIDANLSAHNRDVFNSVGTNSVDTDIFEGSPSIHPAESTKDTPPTLSDKMMEGGAKQLGKVLSFVERNKALLSVIAKTLAVVTVIAALGAATGGAVPALALVALAISIGFYFTMSNLDEIMGKLATESEDLEKSLVENTKTPSTQQQDNTADKVNANSHPSSTPTVPPTQSNSCEPPSTSTPISQNPSTTAKAPTPLATTNESSQELRRAFDAEIDEITAVLDTFTSTSNPTIDKIGAELDALTKEMETKQPRSDDKNRELYEIDRSGQKLDAELDEFDILLNNSTIQPSIDPPKSDPSPPSNPIRFSFTTPSTQSTASNLNDGHNGIATSQKEQLTKLSTFSTELKELKKTITAQEEEITTLKEATQKNSDEIEELRKTKATLKTPLTSLKADAFLRDTSTKLSSLSDAFRKAVEDAAQRLTFTNKETRSQPSKIVSPPPPIAPGFDWGSTEGRRILNG